MIQIELKPNQQGRERERKKERKNEPIDNVVVFD